MGENVLDGAVEDDVAIDVAVEMASVVSLDPVGHAGEKRQTAAVQSRERKEGERKHTQKHLTNQCSIRGHALSRTHCQ